MAHGPNLGSLALSIQEMGLDTLQPLWTFTGPSSDQWITQTLTVAKVPELRAVVRCLSMSLWLIALV